MVAITPSRERTRPGLLGRSLRVPGAGAAAAAALVTAAALLPVVQSSNATTAGYETRRLEQQKADLQASIYRAQTDVAQLGSLDRIDREARGRLGMVPADRFVTLTVGEAPQSTNRVPTRYYTHTAAPATDPPARTGGLRAIIGKLLHHS